MNIQKHFENEIKILKKRNKDFVLYPYLNSIQDIIDVFRSKGHSGFSGSYTRKVICTSIDRILDHRPLSPLWGTNDEWNDVSEENGKKLFQNKRDLAVFKSDTETYFVDGIIWENIDKNDDSFTGNVQGIDSSVPVKFPLETKTFRINVRKYQGKCKITNKWYENGDGKYHYEIVDWRDLKEIEKYYNFKF